MRVGVDALARWCSQTVETSSRCDDSDGLATVLGPGSVPRPRHQA
jgi:hypothetical protein